MTNVMPILNEFQNGSRNARVYKTANGEYGVITYDSNDDYNGFQSFDIIAEAEKFAKYWVVADDTI